MMRPQKILSGMLLLTLALVLTQATLFAQSVDLILFNGKIFTSDNNHPYVQAIAIKGNKIFATGNNEDIHKLASAATKSIDLQGKTVVPGINDAHDHLGWFASVGLGYHFPETNAAGLSKEAVIDSVSRLVKLAKPNQWIHGFIGTTVLYDSSMRKSLDIIAPNNPVALFIWWGHGIVVNGKALEASGLSDKTPDPIGGWYARDTSSKIFALHQNAQLPAWNAWSISEPDNLIKGLQAYAQEQLAGGITTVQQMSSTLNGLESSRIFKAANLPQRIRIIAWPHSTSTGRKLNEWNFQNQNLSPRVSITGVKYTIDGTPMEGNALRSEPYPGRPGWYGRFNYPIDTMKKIFREALTSDRQLMMHITADSSFAVVLNLMKAAGSGAEWRPKRVRIEHNCVGFISPAQQEMIKDMGILLMHTPKYCDASQLPALIRSGITVGISPDGTTNPFIDIMILTTGSSSVAEKMTVEQAVIAFTKANAYAEFAEKTKGTLTKGMLADLAVLTQDIFTVAPQQLPLTQSVLTIIDGKIVYEQQEGLHKR